VGSEGLFTSNFKGFNGLKTVMLVDVKHKLTSFKEVECGDAEFVDNSPSALMARLWKKVN